MNSQIFVQASTGTPNSELATSLEVVAGNPRQLPHTVPVPAIVRPFNSSNTDGGSVRLDAASERVISSPHHRTHKLEDYVNWLKARVAGDPLEAQTTPALDDEEIDTGRQTTTAHSEESQPNPEVTFADREATTGTTEQLGGHERIDAAHAAIATPSTSAWKFQSKPDLERIEAKLTQQRIGDSIEPETVVADDDKTKLDQPVDSTTNDLVGVDADRIIATVSRAIASVLTGHTEAAIEAKIRSELDNPQHREALGALPPHVAEQIVSEVQPAVTTEPAAQNLQVESEHLVESESEDQPNLSLKSDSQFETGIRSEQAEVNELATSEIPTSIAAWDVEEFRWPKVTGQMIATGSKAIEQLVESVFDLVSASSVRLAVTSSGRGEGATSIAISLSRWAAAAGKRVLLVDADLASPGLSSQIGLGPNISWLNAISSGLDSAEVIIRSQKSHVCVMPMAPIVTRVGWPRFIYDSLGELTNRVQPSFDLIVYDVGPVSQLPAELSQASLMVDVGLLVHSDMASSRFQKSKETLDNFGITKYALAHNSAVQQKANVA